MSLLHRCAPRIASLAKGRVHPQTPISHPSPSRHTSSRQQQQRRRFHLTASSTLGHAIVLTADGISAIHAAGLPWYLTIPLAALGVNLSIRLPLQHYTRRLVLRRAELNPLVSAWAARHSHAASSAHQADDHQVGLLRAAGPVERSRRRIYKAFGVQRWKSLAPFLSMLPFVVVSEALRRLCGAPTGWLSHKVGLAHPTQGDALLAADTLSDTGTILGEQLAQGGCLWFADLTAMDPYCALPAACSALLARTSWGRLSREQLRALLSLDGAVAGKRSPAERIQTGVGRVLLLVPLFPLVFADLPSAIFLYWAATFALNDVNEVILQRLVPRRAPGLRVVRRVPTVWPFLRGK